MTATGITGIQNRAQEKPDRLPMAETRRALVFFNWSFGFRWIYSTVAATGNMAPTAFVLALGIAKEQIGLIASALSFACLIQILGIPLLNHTRDKKRLAVGLCLAEPLILIAGVILLPFLPAAGRLPLLTLVVFAAAAAASLNLPLTENWLATTIPEGIRGRFLGRRAQVMCLTGSLTMLALGFLMEWIGQANVWGLAGLLLIGAVFGILAAIPLAKAAIPELVSDAHIDLSTFREVPRNRVFRRFVCGCLLFNLPNLLIAPYIQVFNLKILGMRESTIAYTWIAYYVVRFFTAPFCGRYIDRLGVRKMLFLAGPTYLVYILAYPLSTPDRIWPIFVAWICAGVGDAGCSIATNSALYGSLPNTPGRPAYFIVNSLVSAGISGLGLLLTVPLLRGLQHIQWHCGPFVFGQFHLYFLACGLFFLCSLQAVRLIGAKAPSAS